MAANTGIVTSSVITSTSQHKRDVSEVIRRLYPELTQMLALVKGSNLDASGKVAYSGKGLISKQAVKRMDPEATTYAPIDVLYTVTSDGNGTTTVGIADTTTWQTGDTICNTRTLEVGIVTALTSGTVLTVLAVTGGTFTSIAGDIVCMLSSAYEEGTSRYNTVTNELSVFKTYLQIFREGISLADSIRMTPQYTNEGMLERYEADKMVQALRKIENSMWLSQQGTAGTTSATIGTFTGPLYTMKGLTNWAGTAINAGGGFNWEYFNTTLFPQMPKTLRADDTVYMAVSRKTAAIMNQWSNNSFLTMSENTGDKKFGRATKSYIMGGNLEVEPIILDIFDTTGGLGDSAIFFQSSDLEYLFLEGYDINVRENAQLPSAMAKTDIIEGYVGLRSKSAGANVKLVTNLFNAA